MKVHQGHDSPSHSRASEQEQELPLAALVPAMPPLARTRVGKTLPAGQSGTLKLMQRLGPSLLLVRYRYDWTGLYRYTTAEILVEALPITRGHRLQDTFAVRLGRQESTLKEAVRRHGGQWDPQLKAWTMQGKAVQQLGLGARVELIQIVDKRHRKPASRHPARQSPLPDEAEPPRIS